MRKDETFDKRTLQTKLKEKLSQAEAVQGMFLSARLTSSKYGVGEVPIHAPARKLRVGQLLSIYQAASEQELAAAVIKIDEDIWLEIVRPIPDVPLKRGEHIGIEAWDDEGNYTFHSVIQETFSEPRLRLRTSLPNTGLAVQRRKSDRLRTSVPFSFTVLDGSETKLIGKETQAKTQDISMGGMAFYSELPLTRGDSLKMTITLVPSSQEIELTGRVVRSAEMRAQQDIVRLVALQFTDLPDAAYNTLLLFLAKNNPGCDGATLVG